MRRRNHSGGETLGQVAIPLYDSRGELMHVHYMEEVQALAESINKVPLPAYQPASQPASMHGVLLVPRASTRCP